MHYVAISQYVYLNSDAEIIYGVTDKDLRGQYWRSRAQSMSVSSDSVVSDDGQSSISRKSFLLKLSRRKV